jgi:hypothetical protein
VNIATALLARRLLMNNALKYVKILEGTGITREQAEAHVQIISDILEGDLVTKQDLLNSENALNNSMERLEHKMLQMEYRMTIKLGSIVTVGIAAAATIIKLL